MALQFGFLHLQQISHTAHLHYISKYEIQFVLIL